MAIGATKAGIITNENWVADSLDGVLWLHNG